VARGAAVYPGARIWYPRNLRMGPFACLGQGVTCYNMALIVLEDHVVVSQGAHLCSGDHDIRDPFFQLTIRPIVLRRECWIAAEAFVGPGVTVGDGAVLGARGVAMKDLQPWAVYVGNPAQQVGMRHPRQAPP
jgi:putative colanic acid biosynthesis acetyltransferase WcaF